MSEIVFVSRHNETEVYHLTEGCDNLQKADAYRRVEKATVENTHRPCGYADCAGEDDHDNVYDSECPLCGGVVPKNKMQDHLPCDGAEPLEVPEP